MHLNNMTEGPKTPCFFFTSGYLQDSPVIGSSKLKMLNDIQELSTFLFFNVFVVRNFYPGFPGPRKWALFSKVKSKKKQGVLGPSVMLFKYIPCTVGYGVGG